MRDAAPRPPDRLLEILAEKIAARTGVELPLARELAISALASPSVDEETPVPLVDATGREVARIPFALVEEAFDDLDDEQDG
jgi:hypothetical protein